MSSFTLTGADAQYYIQKLQLENQFMSFYNGGDNDTKNNDNIPYNLPQAPSFKELVEGIAESIVNFFYKRETFPDGKTSLQIKDEFANTIFSGSPDALMISPEITGHVYINGYDWELGGYIIIMKGNDKGIYKYTDLGYIRVSEEVGISANMKFTALWAAGIEDKDIVLGDFEGKRVQGAVAGNIPGVKGATYGFTASHSIPDKSSRCVIYGLGFFGGIGYYALPANVSVNYGTTVITK